MGRFRLNTKDNFLPSLESFLMQSTGGESNSQQPHTRPGTDSVVKNGLLQTRPDIRIRQGFASEKDYKDELTKSTDIHRLQMWLCNRIVKRWKVTMVDICHSSLPVKLILDHCQEAASNFGLLLEEQLFFCLLWQRQNIQHFLIFAKVPAHFLKVNKKKKKTLKTIVVSGRQAINNLKGSLCLRTYDKRKIKICFCSLCWYLVTRTPTIYPNNLEKKRAELPTRDMPSKVCESIMAWSELD